MIYQSISTLDRKTSKTRNSLPTAIDIGKLDPADLKELAISVRRRADTTVLFHIFTTHQRTE